MCNKTLIKHLLKFNSNSFSKSYIHYSNSKRTNSGHLKFGLPNLQLMTESSRTPYFIQKHIFPNEYHISMRPSISVHVFNSTQFIGVRYYSTKKQQELPKLMDSPQVVWPSVFKTIRNWVLSNFIIMRYFDSEFSLPEFVSCSKQAVELVSGMISKGEVDHLSGLVTPEVINQVKESLNTFTLKQRQEFAVRSDDVYFCFPYEVGIMFPNEDRNEGENQSRFVEITMCYHVMHGLKEMKEAGISPPVDMGMVPEYQEKLFVCNYRFIREFTKGVQDDWTINAINHFKPAVSLNL